MKLFDTTCTISYYAEGSRDDLGVPGRTLTERDSNVPCNLQPRSASLSYELPAYVRRIDEQGRVKTPTHIAYLKKDQTVETDDIITDVDGNYYLVAHVVNRWRTHREILLSLTTL